MTQDAKEQDVAEDFRTLDALAHLPRWVAWREETRGGKPTKIPYDAYTNRQARIPTHPETWGTRAQAERRWCCWWSVAATGGVGIVLGDLGNGTHLLGLDLDGCIEVTADNKVIIHDPIAEEIIDDHFKTYTEISPSGKGVKLFFLVADTDMPEVQARIGYNADGSPKTRRSFTAGTHREIAIDCARYYTVTREHLEGTPAT